MLVVLFGPREGKRMVKSLVIAMASSLVFSAQAADWSFLQTESDNPLYVKSYSGVLLGNQSHLGDNFDLWLINTGYQYPLQDDISLYMEAGPAIGPKVGRPGSISALGCAIASPRHSTSAASSNSWR